MNNLQYTVLDRTKPCQEGIHPSLQFGKNVVVGMGSVIEENVVIGKGCVIGHHVLLKSNTVIGENTFIDSSVISSGDCTIGNNCQIRYQSIIARGVHIGNNVFFSAGVKTAYLNPNRKGVKGIIIGDNCFLGDDVTVMPGLVIGSNCIIGAKSLVTVDIKPNGVWYGVPARFKRNIRKGELHVSNTQ